MTRQINKMAFVRWGFYSVMMGIGTLTMYISPSQSLWQGIVSDILIALVIVGFSTSE